LHNVRISYSKRKISITATVENIDKSKYIIIVSVAE